MSLTDNREIAALIARLLSHYWTGDDPEATRQAQIEDWLEDLREFGPEIVAVAMRIWRRKPGGKRPLPGDIRALCIEEQRDRREYLALPGPELSEGEIHQLADAYAKDHGFACIEAFQRAGNSVVMSVGPGKLRRFDGLPQPLPDELPDRVRGFRSAGAAAKEHLA